MHLIQFKPEEIDKVWPLVKDKIQEALTRNHNFRDHWHVKEQCKNSLEQLWVVVDDNDDIHGVCITAIVQHPNYNIGVVRIATGHDLPLWVNQIDEFENEKRHDKRISYSNSHRFKLSKEEVRIAVK